MFSLGNTPRHLTFAFRHETCCVDVDGLTLSIDVLRRGLVMLLFVVSGEILLTSRYVWVPGII